MRVICLTLSFLIVFAYGDESFDIDGVKLGGQISDIRNFNDYVTTGKSITKFGEFYGYSSKENKIGFVVFDGVVCALVRFTEEDISPQKAKERINEIEHQWGSIKADIHINKYALKDGLWIGYIYPQNSDVGVIEIMYTPTYRSDNKLGYLRERYILKTHMEFFRNGSL